MAELSNPKIDEKDFKSKLSSVINHYNRCDFQQALKKAKDLISESTATSYLHNMIGLCLFNLGKKEQSLKNFRNALYLEPTDPTIYFNIVNVLKDQKKYQEALKIIKIAIEIKPDFAKFFNIGGEIFQELGNYKKAREYYEKAVILDPNNYEVHYNLGVVCNNLNRYSLALKHLKKASTLNQDNQKIFNSLGIIFIKIQNYKEAIINFEKAIKIDKNFAEPYFNLGVINSYKENKTVAIKYFKAAIKLKSDYAVAYNNLGVLMQSLGDFKIALKNFQLALRFNPNHLEAHFNLANCFYDIGDLDKAIENYEICLEIDPSFHSAQYGKSLSYLKSKNFNNGWLYYESRLKFDDQIVCKIKTTKQKWEPGKFNRVLLLQEQGVGDKIFMSSIFEEFNLMCSKLIVLTDNRLIPIFRRSFSKSIEFRSLDKSANIQESLYDNYIQNGSLLKFLRNDIQDFKKTSKKYLIPNFPIVKKIRKELLNRSDDILIGISWKSGSKTDSLSNKKSIKLIELAKALNFKGVKLVNLQHGNNEKEFKYLKKYHNIKIEELSSINVYNDIDGLLSIIGACDEIVTVDNFINHLAGAIGKKTRVLLPFSSEWRWGINQKKSYWHSSINLYQQSKISNWDTPLSDLILELKESHKL